MSRDEARDPEEREREHGRAVDEEEGLPGLGGRRGGHVVERGGELVAVGSELVDEKTERWQGQRRGNDPLPRRGPTARHLTHDRLAEPEWKYLRRHAREELVQRPLGRIQILRREAAHAVLPLMRAARRTLSAALARCKCVFTVPRGMPNASATSRYESCCMLRRVSAARYAGGRSSIAATTSASSSRRTAVASGPSSMFSGCSGTSSTGVWC